jgi:hypothetical protein
MIFETPGTLALAALGGASRLRFRRQKQSRLSFANPALVLQGRDF